ncbi:family 43 putative glycoside hydrolase, partial [Podospora australis]
TMHLPSLLLVPILGLATAQTSFNNPVIWQDHPDLDVFRVGSSYYYSSSTFAYSPGAPVLRSYDLVNWEPVSHSVPSVSSFGSAYSLEGGKRAYVKGIWASTLRYRASSNTFYWLGCIESSKTYVFSSPGGPSRGENMTEADWNWTKRAEIPTCYYDAGLFIDDDDSMYVAYGNGQIRVAQLTAASNGDLRETKNQLVYSHSGSGTVEGARMYKFRGNYYIFVTRPADAELVLKAASPFGTYTQRAFVDRMSGPLTNAGFAHQGGIVDTPDGKWFYVAFLDAYPGGRIPVIAPLNWDGSGWPSVVKDGSGGWGKSYPLPVNTTRKVAGNMGLGMDAFRAGRLGHAWEWNHAPDDTKWGLLPEGGLRLRTATITGDLFSARNTLTHRIAGPKSRGTFRVDVSGMKDGDRAGAVLFRDIAAYIGVHKTGNTASVVVVDNLNLVEGTWTTSSTGRVAATGATLSASTGEIWLRVQADITPAFGTNTGRQATFSYSLDGGKTFAPLGSGFAMSNSWRYFTGYRYGVFNFATKAVGGEVKVKSFSMELV